jgi:hypothetical protein
MPKKSTVEEPKKSPKITVETFDDAEEVSVTETKPTSILDPVSAPSNTKFSSFSQLDADKTKSLEELDQASKAKVTEVDVKDTIDTVSSETPKADIKTELPEEKSVSSDEIKEWLKEVKPDTTKEVESKGGVSGRSIVLIFLILLLVGVVAGGLYYFNSRVNPTTVIENENAVEEEQVEQTPTPTVAEVELDTLKVNILNGNGTAGEAGRVKETLEGVGFKEFTSGNAANYNYTSTEISMKDSVPESVFTKIKESLTKTYIVEKSETKLGADSSYDIVIIIGAKRS